MKSLATQNTKNHNELPKIEDEHHKDRKNPLRFWEIDSFFKCPMIGMCLTLSEQKQILKKAGISIKNKSPYEIHEILVASSDNESRLSRKVDRLLNRKYGKESAELLDLHHEAFRRHF